MSIFLRLRERVISKITENTAFACTQCGVDVLPLVHGSYRNHCPACLWSRHVDVRPGDRAADCGAPMRPVGWEQRPGKGFVVIHECVRCGCRRANRLALDDRRQPDDIDAVASLPPAQP